MSVLDEKFTSQVFCQYVPYEKSIDGNMTEENDYNKAVKRLPPLKHIVSYGYGRNGVDLPLISSLSFGSYDDCAVYNMSFRYDTTGENSRALSRFYSGNYFMTYDYDEMVVRLRVLPKDFKTSPHSSEALYNDILGDPYDHVVCRSFINVGKKKILKLPIADCELIHQQKLEIGQCIVYKHRYEKRFIRLHPINEVSSGFEVFKVNKSNKNYLIFEIRGKKVVKIM